MKRLLTGQRPGVHGCGTTVPAQKLYLCKSKSWRVKQTICGLNVLKKIARAAEVKAVSLFGHAHQSCSNFKGNVMDESESNALTPTEVLTQRAMLNAMKDEAKLHGINPIVVQKHEVEISSVIQKLIVASRDK